MLSGELPFRGTTAMVLHQVLHEEPKPPRRLDDHAPRNLETVCLKAMAKAPATATRTPPPWPPTCVDFLRGEPVRPRPLGRLARTWRWCRRNPLPAGLAAVLLSVTLAGLVGVTRRPVAGRAREATGAAAGPAGRALRRGRNCSVPLSGPAAVPCSGNPALCSRQGIARPRGRLLRAGSRPR